MRRLYLLAAIPLAACAQSPESIPAAYTSEVPYLSWSCAHLAEEAPRLQAALATASAQQNVARSNDVAGVLFLGLPMGSMSGQNVAPQVARLRGEIEAVDRAGRRNGCGAQAAAPLAVAP